MLWSVARGRRLLGSAVIAGTFVIGMPAIGSGSESVQGPLKPEDPVLKAGVERQLAKIEAATRARTGAGAREKRRRSRTRWVGLSRNDALSVARQALDNQQSETPTSTIPSLRPGQKIKSFLSNRAAIVEDDTGKRVLLETVLPMRAPGQDGAAPVDLRLRADDRGFAPSVPLVPVQMPETLSEPVALTKAGVTLGQQVRRPQELGTRVSDTEVAYPNADTDTDVVNRVTPLGFETFSVLRSARSPQSLTYTLSTPGGTMFSRTRGGTAVVRDGQTLAVISDPVAWDSNHQPVPLSTTLEHGVLNVNVEHRSMDVAYPVVVDPSVTVAFPWEPTGGGTINGWAFADPAPTGRFSPFVGAGYLGVGLYIRDFSGHSYNDGEQGYWYYRAASDATITEASWSYMSHDDAPGAGTCVFAGVIGGTNANWVGSNSPWIACYNFYDVASGVQSLNVADTSPGNAAVWGVQIVGSGYHVNYMSDLGQASFQVTDYGEPYWTTVSGADWNATGATSVLRIAAHDYGLGVKSVSVTAPDDPAWTGGVSQVFSCDGSQWAPCARDQTVQATVANLSPGQHRVSATARDLVGNTWTREWTVTVADPPPTLTPDDASGYDGGEDTSDDGAAAGDWSQVDAITTCQPDPDLGDDGNWCPPDDTSDSTLSALDAEPQALSGTRTNLRTEAYFPPKQSLALGMGKGRALGISDNMPGTFNDSRFTTLGVKRMRLTVSWDLFMHPSDPSKPWSTSARPALADEQARVEQWMAGVRAASDEPLVSFDLSRQKATPLDLIPNYKTAVTRFIEKYPFVKLYTAMNEPNNSAAPTAGHPAWAGNVYRLLSKVCHTYDPWLAKVPGCTVAAGDFLDNWTFSADYLATYMTKAGLRKSSQVPWAFHPYSEANSFTRTGNRVSSTRLQQLLDHTSGRVWFSEIGGVVRDQQITRATKMQAAANLDYALHTLGAKSRVTRIYVYQWRGAANNWDSGLVSVDGSQLRLSYCVMWMALGLPSWSCHATDLS